MRIPKVHLLSVVIWLEQNYDNETNTLVSTSERPIVSFKGKNRNKKLLSATIGISVGIAHLCGTGFIKSAEDLVNLAIKEK